MIAKYGAENAPPPWQTFTIANDIQDGNFHFVQKVFEGPFEVSVFFGDFAQRVTDRTSLIFSILRLPLQPLYLVGLRPALLDVVSLCTLANDLTNAIKSSIRSFSDRFSKLLAPRAPFDKSKYQAFARSMFSNLLGGIGYFYGDAVVDKSYAPEYEEENEGFWDETAEARGRSGVHKLEGPLELYTSIPSRPFFPRGFLWDEGFHLLPVADWDMDLT